MDNIRWMLRRDMPLVLEIERESFDFPWAEDDFLVCLRSKNRVGMVIERDGEVEGFMVYRMHRSRIYLIDFAVASAVRRTGLGTQMAQRLIDKLSQQRRKEIHLEISERNLPGQLFFKSQGFRATKIMTKPYSETDDDAYLMRYQLRCFKEKDSTPVG